MAPDDELQLDRLIHEPARLAILTVLSSVKDADFTFLQRTTGLTKGNLSSHLSKLEAAGLVGITKTFIRKKPNTSVALTPAGRERVARHWQQLERLRHLTVAQPRARFHRVVGLVLDELLELLDVRGVVVLLAEVRGEAARQLVVARGRDRVAADVALDHTHSLTPMSCRDCMPR